MTLDQVLDTLAKWKNTKNPLKSDIARLVRDVFTINMAGEKCRLDYTLLEHYFNIKKVDVVNRLKARGVNKVSFPAVPVTAPIELTEDIEAFIIDCFKNNQEKLRITEGRFAGKGYEWRKLSFHVSHKLETFISREQVKDVVNRANIK